MRTTFLNTIYARNRKGLPVLGTPEDAAKRFSGDLGTPREKSETVARWYVGFCGATGFVCGLPGWLLLPVTLPSNVAGVGILQMHMVQTIALLHGHSLEDLETRNACVACLLEKLTDEGTNSEEGEVAARTGIKFIEKGARAALGHVSSLAGRAARSAALRRLRISRLPLFGGLIGAGSDAYMTRHVAGCAVRRFGLEGNAAPVGQA